MRTASKNDWFPQPPGRVVDELVRVLDDADKGDCPVDHGVEFSGGALGSFKLIFGLGELVLDAGLLGLEELERQRIGVVDLEELLAFGAERGDALLEPIDVSYCEFAHSSEPLGQLLSDVVEVAQPRFPAVDSGLTELHVAVRTRDEPARPSPAGDTAGCSRCLWPRPPTGGARRPLGQQRDGRRPHNRASSSSSASPVVGPR